MTLYIDRFQSEQLLPLLPLKVRKLPLVLPPRRGRSLLFIREAYIQRREFLISDGRNAEVFGSF
mgnify:CR=1 FL=1